MCVVVSVALRLIDVPHGCCICPPGCNPISLREAFWLPYDDGATEITQNSSAIFLPGNAARHGYSYDEALRLHQQARYVVSGNHVTSISFRKCNRSQIYRYRILSD